MIKSLQEYRRDPVAMVQTIREKMLESGKSPDLPCDDNVIENFPFCCRRKYVVHFNDTTFLFGK